MNKQQKRNVLIRLTTVIDGQQWMMDAQGELYERGGSYYIRYEEPSTDLKGVTTTLKISPGSIAVLRHGAVRSEQRFAAGSLAVGYYETAQGTFRLETRTKEIEVAFRDGVGTAAWEYVLWIGGAEAGHFQMFLDVQEAKTK